MGSDQSVGDDIFYLKLFLTIHQLWPGWGGLVRGPYLWSAGVIGLQVLHILKLGEKGEAWGDLHSDKVGPSDLQHLEGSQPPGGQLLARKLEVVVFCSKQNQVSNLQP